MRGLLALALLVTPVSVLSAPRVLERIEVSSGTAATVRLHLSSPVEARARSLAGDGTARARVCVDLPQTSLGPSLSKVVAGTGPIVRVRIGQFDATTARVVLDLEKELPFKLDGEGSLVIVTVEPGAVKVPATRTSPARKPRSSRAQRKPYLDYEDLGPLLPRSSDDRPH